jgi:hypothetical protein
VAPRPTGPDGRLTVGAVAITPDGRTLTVVVLCGGKLTVREGTQVFITWIASAVGPGAMSCATVALTARLQRPLARRPLVDTVTGRTLRPVVCNVSGPAIYRTTCR